MLLCVNSQYNSVKICFIVKHMNDYIMGEGVFAVIFLVLFALAEKEKRPVHPQLK